MTPIRAAHPDDAEAIGEAHAEAWRVGYAQQFPPDVLAQEVAFRRTRWDAETVRANGEGDEVLLVAEDDHGVCGFVHGVRGEVGGLYVHPRAWGTGAVREREFMGGVTFRLVEYARRLP